MNHHVFNGFEPTQDKITEHILDKSYTVCINLIQSVKRYVPKRTITQYSTNFFGLTDI